MRVAFFGGSFNPPHVGHVLAASYALSVGFDKVLAVVVHQHAFPKQLESFEHRATMAELAFEPLPSVEVSRVEAQLPAPNFTLHTLQHLHAAHPEWRLRLLAGSDVLPDLERWHAFDEVARLAPLYLLGRIGHPVSGVPCLLPDVSSTNVRRQLQAASPDVEWLHQHVPASVLAYIEARGLFQPADEP